MAVKNYSLKFLAVVYVCRQNLLTGYKPKKDPFQGEKNHIQRWLESIKDSPDVYYSISEKSYPHLTRVKRVVLNHMIKEFKKL